MIILKGPTAITKLRAANQIVAQVLDFVQDIAIPGITTMQIDTIVEDLIRDKGATPAFKGYEGYPNTICASLNTCVVHGIPNDMYLGEGDVLSVDVGVLLDGYYGDSARTYAIGTIDPDHQILIACAKESLFRGIEMARVGNTIGDIGFAIQSYAESMEFGVLRDYCGHGIGESLHEEPPIPNFGRPGHGPDIMSGMVLAIEPMITQFSNIVSTARDGWSVLTGDGGYAAHFEHTVLVDEIGPQILSLAG